MKPGSVEKEQVRRATRETRERTSKGERADAARAEDEHERQKALHSLRGEPVRASHVCVHVTHPIKRGNESSVTGYAVLRRKLATQQNVVRSLRACGIPTKTGKVGPKKITFLNKHKAVCQQGYLGVFDSSIQSLIRFKF